MTQVNWDKCVKTIKRLWSDEAKAFRAQRFMAMLKYAISTSHRPTKSTQNNQVAWWDDELAEIRKFKIATRNAGDFPQYLLFKAQFRRTIRSKKTAHYTKLLKEIAHAANPWKIFRQIEPRSKFRKAKSPAYTNPRRVEHISRLADEYEALLNSAPSIMEIPDFDPENRISITERELMAAVKRSKKTSASGLDSINYRTIEHLTNNEQFRKILLCVLNNWSRHGFPPECKLAKIHPIPKGQTEQDGFRPISLLSCTAKLCERILAARLSRMVEHLLPANQSVHWQ